MDPTIQFVYGTERGGCPGTISSFRVINSAAMEYWQWSTNRGTFVDHPSTQNPISQPYVATNTEVYIKWSDVSGVGTVSATGPIPLTPISTYVNSFKNRIPPVIQKWGGNNFTNFDLVYGNSTGIRLLTDFNNFFVEGSVDNGIGTRPTSYELQIPKGWKIGSSVSDGVTPLSISLSQSSDFTLVPNPGNGGIIRGRAVICTGANKSVSEWTTSVQVTRSMPPPIVLNLNVTTVNCGSTTPVVFTATPLPEATYTWNFPADWVPFIPISPTSSSISLIPSGNSGGSVTVTTNFKIDEINRTLTASVAIPYTFKIEMNSPATICSGQDYFPSISPLPNSSSNTYEWTCSPNIKLKNETDPVFSQSVTSTLPGVLMKYNSNGSGWLKCRAYNPSCGYSEYEEKLIQVGVPNAISNGALNGPTNQFGGFWTILKSSPEATFSVTTEGTNNCSGFASIQNPNILRTICDIQESNCHYTARVSATNVCGVVNKNFSVRCYKTGGPKLLVVPQNPIKGTHSSISVSVFDAYDGLSMGGFSGLVKDKSGRVILKFVAASNPYNLDIQLLEPAEYVIQIQDENLNSAEIEFNILKTSGDKFVVSPNPAVKQIDDYVQLKVIDSSTNDEHFEVTVDDFNGMRHLSFSIEGREFPMDVTGLDIGNYVITVAGENSFYQENLEMILRGKPYLQIAPNPVGNFLNGEIINPISQNFSFKISVTDKFGNTRKTYETMQNPINLDVSDLSPDLYFIHLYSGNEEIGKIFQKL